ncbi:U3 small nucleolar RNA-associated protein 18 homolog [Drosophila grimshawi]|uniref:GH21920 n=1 Tax=Drosophila grimshawi TaxID=7222 RepID=B4J8E8_DROGR|nr:U3 small nucleolar RNA-associated protein 18 homolog [Drosophila grimshawi]EDW02307.1 GH21920 [Drosophila grimshawi]
MSDDESSDGLEELKELMAVYAKHENKSDTTRTTASDKKDAVEATYVEVPTEKVVFGDMKTFLSNLAKSVGKKRAKREGESKTVATDNYDEDEQEESAKKPKPAWTDSDDEDIQLGDIKRATRHTGPLTHLRKDKSYKEYLTARFQRTVSQPKWATLGTKTEHADSDGADDASEEEPLLKTVGFIDHKAKSRGLRPTNLQFKRARDLNRATYSEGVVSSIQFHPTSTAALVAGESCLATIYSVDGVKNEKLHSIRFHKFPLTCARIAPCGTRAFFGSVRPFYYSYDLLEAKETKLKLPSKTSCMRVFEVSPCGKYIVTAGKFGAIHLLTSHTNELLHSFKQEGPLMDMCFTADSQRLLCVGSNCNVNVLSLRQNRIEHSFIDDGCVQGKSIQLSPNQRLLATGSNEGVVNLYDYESIYKSGAPQPEKRFMNLRTAITDLQFNHTSELLAMGSRLVPNAIKVAHFPTATVYANFPNQQENVGYVNTMAFSPNSGYFAIGSKGKKAPLFRLKHFKNY